MDERAGGLLRVGFTEHQTELVAQMKHELEGQLAAPDRITGFLSPPTFTVESVENAATAIQTYVNTHTANIVGSVFVPATNRVRVSAINVPAAEAEVGSVIGSLARAEFVQAPEAPRPWAGRYRSSGPIKAGDYMETIAAPAHNCTAGYGVAERGPPGQAQKKYLLSAGHCFAFGNEPRRADNPSSTDPKDWKVIGKVVRTALPETPVAGETDALVISLPSNSLAPTEIFKSRPVGPLAVPSEWQLLEKLCYSGPEAGSAPVCGISAGVEPYSWNFDGVHTGRMLGIRLVGVVRGGPGDSGAPVWNDATGKSVGIVSGGSVAAHEVIVTPLSPLASRSGVSQPGALKALSEGDEPLALNRG